MDTLAFALFLLRTNTSAYSRKSRSLLENLSCIEEMATLDVFDERRNIDIDRTTLNASWFATVKATLSLEQCHVGSETDVYFLQTSGGTINRVEFRHLHTLNLLSLCWLHLGTKLLTPFCIAIGERRHVRVALIVLRRSVVNRGCDLAAQYSFAMFFVVFHLFALSSLECAHALEHLVPIDQGSIKLRTIDTYELCFATNGESASTTHTCAVDHDGVERDVGRNVVFLCEQAAELHHDRRANGKHLVDVFLLDKLFDADSDNTLFASRTIVGHDDNLVGIFANLVFQDYQVFIATCQYREHSVASSLESLDDREHRSYTNATTGTDNCAKLLDVSRVAKRTNNVGDEVALVEIAELC